MHQLVNKDFDSIKTHGTAVKKSEVVEFNHFCVHKRHTVVVTGKSFSRTHQVGTANMWLSIPAAAAAAEGMLLSPQFHLTISLL